MLSVDLHYLLEKAFSDGFTNDNLSNVTGVSIDLIISETKVSSNLTDSMKTKYPAAPQRHTKQ